MGNQSAALQMQQGGEIGGRAVKAWVERGLRLPAKLCTRVGNNMAALQRIIPRQRQVDDARPATDLLVTDSSSNRKRALRRSTAIAARKPVRKLSRHVTEWPSASSLSHRKLLRKPAPSVTRVRFNGLLPAQSDFALVLSRLHPGIQCEAPAGIEARGIWSHFRR
jgi:hypothetical protein